MSSVVSDISLGGTRARRRTSAEGGGVEGTSSKSSVRLRRHDMGGGVEELSRLLRSSSSYDSEMEPDCGLNTSSWLPW